MKSELTKKRAGAVGAAPSSSIALRKPTEHLTASMAVDANILDENLPSEATPRCYPQGERHCRGGRIGRAATKGAILFDQPYRGDVWRLEIASHDGRTFGNWRKWYREGDILKPTRQGVTIPLERLSELHAALTAHLAGEAPEPPSPVN